MALKILFTGIGRRVELVQAFKQASLVLGRKIIIYGADMTKTAPALAYCDHTRILPAIKDRDYIPSLLSICEKEKIDLVIPTIDTDLLILSDNKRSFEGIGTKVMVSSPKMISICRDKNYTSQFFKECGLKAPIPVNNWKDYRLGYPAFIKPKDGSSSINAFKINNAKDLENYANQVPDYIVQPFIDGTEYTVDIFCDFDGQPISIVPRVRVQIRAGEVIKTKISMDETIIEESRKIIDRFKPCGPLTVQLIRDKETGVDYYIEINPRFGGGSPLSMKAGARSAEAIINLLDGKTVDYCDDIAEGALFSRFDQSVCIVEGDSTIKGVIFDLDDTLYSEKEYVKSGFKVVSDYLGENHEELLWDFFMEKKLAIDELLKRIGRENEKDTILDIYRDHKPSIHLYDGVEEMLLELKSKDYLIGIITDGRPGGQRNKIDALGLGEYVNDIIITDELGGEQFRKPCDIAFRIMQNKWRLHPSQIIYIGDNPTKDIQPPRQIGMKTVYFNNHQGIYYDNERNEEGIIESIDDIRDLRRLLF